MLFPFLNEVGELEEYDLPDTRSYYEIPRPPKMDFKMILNAKKPDDSIQYHKEVFKRKDLAYKIKGKYCRVHVYVSEEFGKFPVEKEHRDGYIEANLHQMAPFLFTYGERYIPTGSQPAVKEK